MAHQCKILLKIMFYISLITYINYLFYISKYQIFGTNLQNMYHLTKILSKIIIKKKDPCIFDPDLDNRIQKFGD